jgi:hypothetical protein
MHGELKCALTIRAFWFRNSYENGRFQSKPTDIVDFCRPPPDDPLSWALCQISATQLMARAAVSQTDPPHFRACWFIRGAKRLRLEAGLSIAELAGEAKVSRDTVRKIEAKLPVTELVASKVIKALRSHFDGSIRLNDYLTTETSDSS